MLLHFASIIDEKIINPDNTQAHTKKSHFTFFTRLFTLFLHFGSLIKKMHYYFYL